MAEILPIRRKTLSNQSINQSINQSTLCYTSRWVRFSPDADGENKTGEVKLLEFFFVYLLRLKHLLRTFKFERI